MTFEMNKSRVLQTAGKSILGIATVGLLSACLAGCGGTGSASLSSNIRIINEIPGSGTASVAVNGVTSNSALAFMANTGYSTYGVGSKAFSFTLNSEQNQIYPTQIVNVAGGAYYSAYLTGLSTVTTSTTPGYPEIFVTPDDTTAPAAGNIRARLVNTAPDIGTVQVLFSGATIGNVQWGSASPYFDEGSPSLNIEIRSGGTTDIVSRAVTVTPGKRYTVILTEPAPGTGSAYAIQVIQDN